MPDENGYLTQDDMPPGDSTGPLTSSLARRMKHQESDAATRAARYMMALEAIWSVASEGGDLSIICEIAQSAVNPELRK